MDEVDMGLLPEVIMVGQEEAMVPRGEVMDPRDLIEAAHQVGWMIWPLARWWEVVEVEVHHPAMALPVDTVESSHLEPTILMGRDHLLKHQLMHQMEGHEWDLIKASTHLITPSWSETIYPEPNPHLPYPVLNMMVL
jgi:hypothetical protein